MISERKELGSEIAVLVLFSIDVLNRSFQNLGRSIIWYQREMFNNIYHILDCETESKLTLSEP